MHDQGLGSCGHLAPQCSLDPALPSGVMCGQVGDGGQGGMKIAKIINSKLYAWKNMY